MSIKPILLVAVLASLLFMGCGNPQKQIVGTWAFTEFEFGGDLANDPVTRAMVTNATEGMRGSTMEFKEDGTFAGKSMITSTSGAYTLTERRIQIAYDGLGDIGRFTGTLSDDGRTLLVDFPTLPGTKLVYHKQ